VFKNSKIVPNTDNELNKREIVVSQTFPTLPVVVHARCYALSDALTSVKWKICIIEGSESIILDCKVIES
jgi:hypothetical protein